MGYARKNLVSLQDTPYYHCGRDAFVGRGCGVSMSTQQGLLPSKGLGDRTTAAALEDLLHRDLRVRGDVESLPPVLYVNRERVRKWSQRTVVEHWEQLFRLPPCVQRWKSHEAS